jgi:DNA-binding beta-propeller fold protein YncE
MAVAPAGDFLYAISNLSVSVFSVSPAGVVAQVGKLTNPGNLAVSNASSLAVHPSGKFLHVSFPGVVFPPPPPILGLPPGPPIPPILSAIYTYAIDAKTGLVSVQSSVPGVATAQYPGVPAEDPAGKFVFLSNFDSSVSAFDVDAATGSLTASGAASPLAGVSAVAVSR